MKIAIVSDTHFGYKRFEQDAFDQGRRAFLMAAEQADVILSPGDIFDSRTPELETIVKVVGIFKEIAQQKKKVFVIPGTHERRSKDLPNPIDVLERAGLVINVHNKTEQFEHNGEIITISGLGGVPEELAAESIKHLKLTTKKGALNIFMFHQTLRELTPAAGESVMSMDDLPPGFDLYICGHYHKRIISLDKEKKFIIPGSTVLTQLKEDEIEEKGFLIIDSKSFSVNFVPIGSRKFFYIKLKFNGATADEIRSNIKNAISQNEAEKRAFRIVLEGTLKHGEDISLLEKEIISTHETFVQIDNKLLTNSALQKIEQIKDFRNEGGSNIMYSILRETIKKSNLEKNFDWGHAFEVFAEGSQSDIDKLINELKEKNNPKANVLKQSTKTN